MEAPLYALMDALNAAIVAFEQTLKDMRGVRASVPLVDGRHLTYTRCGNDFALMVGVTRLVSCSLAVRLEAVTHLEALYQAFCVAYEASLPRVVHAIDSVNAITARITGNEAVKRNEPERQGASHVEQEDQDHHRQDR